MEWGNTLLDDHVLSLTGVERPRVCFLPTASGDADHYVVRFYRAFDAGRFESRCWQHFSGDGGADAAERQAVECRGKYCERSYDRSGDWRSTAVAGRLRRVESKIPNRESDHDVR